MNEGKHTVVGFYKVLEAFTFKDGGVRLAWVSYMYTPSRSVTRRCFAVEEVVS